MLTRLGLTGIPRPLYGDFSTKEEQAPSAVSWTSNFDILMEIIE